MFEAILAIAVIVLLVGLLLHVALRDIASKSGDIAVCERPSELEPTPEELAEQRRDGPR
jgi:hypothetical protein